MSRAEYMREYQARQKARAAALAPGTRVVIGDDAVGLYLARIAELEEEARTLKAELAMREASAFVGGGDRPAEPPSLVTADGTRGLQRGVSPGPRRGRGALASAPVAPATRRDFVAAGTVLLVVGACQGSATRGSPLTMRRSMPPRVPTSARLLSNRISGPVTARSLAGRGSSARSRVCAIHHGRPAVGDAVGGGWPRYTACCTSWKAGVSPQMGW